MQQSTYTALQLSCSSVTLRVVMTLVYDKELDIYFIYNLLSGVLAC
jgi:hypothetical protein